MPFNVGVVGLTKRLNRISEDDIIATLLASTLRIAARMRSGISNPSTTEYSQIEPTSVLG
jgi:hypothetical protein